MHDNSLRGLVKRGHELLIDDHLADDRVDVALGQIEHVRETLNRDRVVDGRVAEEIGSHGLLLDLLGEHVLDVARLRHEVPHLGVHLVVDEVRDARAPVAVAHRSRRRHNVLAHVLWWTHHWLTFAELKLVVELFRDETLLRLEISRAHEWDLDEHGRHQVHALQKL